MKNQGRNNRNFNRDYKLVIQRIPGTNITFIYVYHFKIGFGACFNSVSDAKYWMDGFRSNDYGHNGRWKY